MDTIHTAETVRQIAATLHHLRGMPTWQRVLIRAASALEASEAKNAALAAENATLREERDEAHAENERWRRFLGPVDDFYAEAFNLMLEAGVYETLTLNKGPEGNDYQEASDNVLAGICELAARAALRQEANR